MARFDETFAALKVLFAPYESRLTVTSDTPKNYMLDAGFAPEFGRPIFFGGVRSGAAYVSLYLMPIYSNPELMGRISDQLRRRLHGKSCFNFVRPDGELFEELAGLIARGFECYERRGYVA